MLYFETEGQEQGLLGDARLGMVIAEGDVDEDAKVIVRSNGTTYAGKDIVIDRWKFGLLATSATNLLPGDDRIAGFRPSTASGTIRISEERRPSTT